MIYLSQAYIDYATYHHAWARLACGTQDNMLLNTAAVLTNDGLPTQETLL